MPLDKDKAEVYQLLADVFCKVLIVVVILAAFVVLVIFLVRDPNLYLGVVTAILPLTLVIILRHYFFARKPR